MLSINTNLSSLISQSNMKQSTGKLNQAVERLSTGYKINHAKDNAANYSISTNMTTKLGAYQVAEENVSMGLDLVATANDIISQMQDRASRLHALSTQARNGTYGGQSLMAMNQEATALVDEIVRLYNTSEYNGVNLFNRTEYTIAEHLPKAGKSGFIDESAITTPVEAQEEYGGFIVNPVEYSKERVDGMVALTDDVDTITSGTEYSIKDVEQLINLAELVNSGVDTTGAIFVLADDIDLSSIDNWTPIGDYSTDTANVFRGTFNGNGHSITGLKINRPDKDRQGLFGYAENSVILNVSIKEANVTGNKYVGALVGHMNLGKSYIQNCYSTGTIVGKDTAIGGLCGLNGNTYIFCMYNYSTCDVTGKGDVGGLFGEFIYPTLAFCYATGNVTATTSTAGGLVAYGFGARFKNSYATGNVTAAGTAGGLIGERGEITNCFATGEVISTRGRAGGLFGSTTGGTITNSYATGNVTAKTNAGGLAGYSNLRITNSFATGNVFGESAAGGLVGINVGNVIDSYAIGDVSGTDFVGGLIGKLEKVSGALTIEGSHSYNDTISGTNYLGSFIGGATVTNDEVTYGSIDIVNCRALNKDYAEIGINYKYANSKYTELLANDDWLNGITDVPFFPTTTTLQVGASSEEQCHLSFNTNFVFEFERFRDDILSDSMLNTIVDFMNQLSDESTKLGSVGNRLESVLDEIAIQYDNLVSSRSTIRDADMAEVSATYIQQQILQEAAATLMSTANQSPAIALQLI